MIRATWDLMRRGLALALCGLVTNLWGQQAIAPVRPQAPVLWRPYRAPEVPAVRLGNSGRLGNLMRAGTLYLTAQDAIALALENNIDLEIARYNPLISVWNLERSEAGGALPGVPGGASQAFSVASGQGVAGSQAAARVTGGGTNTTTTGTGGNATVAQIGPVTQTLDPAFQETTTFGHQTTPQPNVVQSLTPALVSNTRVYTGTLQQGLITGGSVSVTYSDHYLNENSSSDVLNPSVAPNLSFTIQHNLLRGFGQAVNARTITIAKINLKTSGLSFKTQVVATVVNVLNLYYALVADIEDVKAKKSALETAQAFLEDSRKRERMGAAAPLDVTSAASQAAASQRDLLVSQTAVQQQEVQLKNVLSRRGVMDPLLRDAPIVPLDQIVIPDKDDLPPIEELMRKALANRSDLATEKANITSAEVSALGTRNGILPTEVVFAGESTAGLAGTARTVGGPKGADPYLIGGIGTGLGQVFRRNYPSERVGNFFQVPLHNRQAQADYGIEQLQLRQTQLGVQKDVNQAGVDVLNSVIALRQARARYDASVKNRVLQEQLLESERKKYDLGASTPYNVIQQQRDLTVAQSTELQARVTYNNARVALDQTLGTTLESNHISIADAVKGKIGPAPGATK